MDAMGTVLTFFLFLTAFRKVSGVQFAGNGVFISS